MVSELKLDDGTWAAFVCERPPDKLLDCIFEHRLQFYEAAKKLRPDEIWHMISITFPTTNILDKELYPGVGRLDVGNAEANLIFLLPAGSSSAKRSLRTTLTT